jgi:signal transduction histidine kinase/DNA-binding response OmpR family regulator
MADNEQRASDSARNFKIRVSIFHKIVFPVLILLLLAIGVGTVITVKLESRAMTNQLLSSVIITARTIASITHNAFGSLNWAYLEEFLHELGREQPGGIVTARVINPQGDVYMAHDRSAYGQAVPQTLLTGKPLTLEDQDIGLEGKSGILLVHPIRIGQQDWHVVLGVSTIHIREAISELIHRSIFWSGAIILLATGATYLLASTLARPVLNLTDTARKVSHGELTHRADVRSRDEIGLLAATFNEMVAHLRTTQIELRKSLTALETANIQLAEETEQARRLAEAAHQASIAKSQFLANMSHELRTPLNGVVSMMELMRDTTLTPEQQEYINMAAVSAESLLGLINDILDFSRIEVGKLELATREFDLEQELDQLSAILSARSKEKQIEIIQHYDAHAPRMVLGDNLRLRQVLFNLGWNAVKFTDTGHILLEIRCKGITKLTADFHFLVQDSGIGIAPEKLQEIFEHFTQADSTSTRQYGGAGLGLAISRQLVRAMGGELRVESVLGKGSSFSFDLQLPLGDQSGVQREMPTIRSEPGSFAAKATSAPPFSSSAQMSLPSPAKAASACASQSEQWSDVAILLVEDHPINRKSVVAILNKMGLAVSTAANGREGVEMIISRRFDLVLMDCQMPIMDGYEATRRIRGWELEQGTEGEGIPIIALTANAMEGDREKCLAAGMTNYLAKPFAKKDFVAMLERYLLPEVRGPGAEAKAAEAATDTDACADTRAAAGTDASTCQVFNHQGALERYDNDLEMTLEMLQDFLQEAPNDLSTLESLLAGKDSETGKAAHRLKGACSYIGAERMRDCCIRIMHAVAEQNWEQSGQAGTDLQREWASFQREALTTAERLREKA